MPPTYPPRFKELFDARSESAFEFFSSPQGISIPIYQRHYSWDSGNIDRLFADAGHGINELVSGNGASSFLGTLITIHETDRRTTKTLDSSHRLTRITTLVDGQQRISTLIICFIILHNRIRRHQRQLSDKNETHKWLSKHCDSILAKLENTYRIDSQVDNVNSRYFPKIIRALSDVWSDDFTHQRYISPITHFTWQYMIHSGENSRLFDFPRRNTPSDYDSHDVILRIAFKAIRKAIMAIEVGDSSSDFPNPLRVTQKPLLFDNIWPSDDVEERCKNVADYISSSPDGVTHAERFSKLLRLTFLAHYLLYYVALTVVETTRDDDALDIFDALNGTGTSLTAFETFKPKVIEHIGDHYPISQSQKYIDSIEGHLARSTNAEGRQKATNETLIAFALTESGKKISRKHSEQRAYLRKSYQDSQSTDSSTAFLRSMFNVSKFLDVAWRSDTSNPFPDLVVNSDAALLALRVLRDLKHTVTIAPIVRFYDHALDGPNQQEQDQRTREMEKAMTATASFSILWRAAKGGTSGIDTEYRKIMSDGVPAHNIPPLARRPLSGAPVAPSITNFLQALRSKIEENWATEDEWVQVLVNQPLYGQKIVARYVLFHALTGTVADSGSEGLICEGRGELSEMLSIGKWSADEFATIEHIAPQKRTEGWQSEIYEDPDIRNSLGNLMLLPLSENASAGARPWNEKRKLYELWSQRADSDFKNYLETLTTAGFSITDEAKRRPRDTGLLASCESLAAVQGPWSVDLIRSRTERLGRLAWKRLFAALKL